MLQTKWKKKKQMENIIKLKDDFLYFITHEFKTPLTVINAAVQTLEHLFKGDSRKGQGINRKD